MGEPGLLSEPAPPSATELEPLALEKVESELQRFLHAATHDLAAPVRQMQMFGQLLQNAIGPGLTPEHLAQLERVLGFADRMDSLVQSLARYADAGGRPTLEPVGLAPLLEAARGRLLCELELDTIDLRVEPNLPSLIADRERLGEVLHQLLENALVHASPAVRIDVGIRSQGPACLIELRDDGPGIDPEHLEDAFAPFRTLVAHELGDQRRTGLGLTLCRRAVERMHGALWAEAPPGGGATFVLRLPPAE